MGGILACTVELQDLRTIEPLYRRQSCRWPRIEALVRPSARGSAVSSACPRPPCGTRAVHRPPRATQSRGDTRASWAYLKATDPLTASFKETNMALQQEKQKRWALENGMMLWSGTRTSVRYDAACPFAIGAEMLWAAQGTGSSEEADATFLPTPKSALTHCDQGQYKILLSTSQAGTC